MTTSNEYEDSYIPSTLANANDANEAARDPREPFVSRRRRLRNRWNVRMVKGERAEQELSRAGSQHR